MRVEKQKFCSDALVKLQDEEVNQALDLLASIWREIVAVGMKLSWPSL